MKRIVCLIAFLVFALTSMIVITITPQAGAAENTTVTERIAAACEKAGCPLDDNQIQKIKALEAGATKESVLALLTEQQRAALQGGVKLNAAEQILSGLGPLLEKAGYPLLAGQVEKIKTLGSGANKEAVLAILTDQQRTALQGGTKQSTAEQILSGLGPQLEKAGYPLLAGQVEKIKTLGSGANKESVLAILTSEQIEVLKGTSDAGKTNTLEKSAGVQDAPKLFNLLKQNYPNPFNPSTTIEYCIEKQGHVLVEVFNSAGQRVATLVNTVQRAGVHTVTLDASGLAGGIYVYNFTTGNFTQSRRMILMK